MCSSITVSQDVSHETFFKNLPVLELIQAIRNDHTLYTKYQHSSKLVAMLNSFAHTDCDLPSEWEKKVEPKTDKVGLHLLDESLNAYMYIYMYLHNVHVVP